MELLTMSEASNLYEVEALEGQEDVGTLLDAWRSAQESGVSWHMVQGIKTDGSLFYLVGDPDGVQSPVDLYQFIQVKSGNPNLTAFNLGTAGSIASRGVADYQPYQGIPKKPQPLQPTFPPLHAEPTPLPPEAEESPTGYLGVFVLQGVTDPQFRYEISSDQVHTLGRSSRSSDIALGIYGNVSRIHAEIQSVKGELFLTDRNSTNGTFVNGVRLVPGQPVQVSDGDVVVFGDYQLTVRQG